MDRAGFLDRRSIPGEVLPTGLILPDDLSFDRWLQIGGAIKGLDRALPWFIGDWLNFGERSYRETYSQGMDLMDLKYQTLANYKWVAAVFELSRRRETLSCAHHAEVGSLPQKEQDMWLDKAESEGWSAAELRRRIKAPLLLGTPPPPTGQYSCIVIDPPWQMEKIDREVRPKQKRFDYAPMSEEELGGMTLPAADNCHLYLWTTHKHLPIAFSLAGLWGFKYECLMTWVKNIGFTPFLRSTEHVLFCRRGSLDLLKLGKRLDFNAKVREHSRKPDEFYELVKQVSPGPRIDMFAREDRDGFDVWGGVLK